MKGDSSGNASNIMATKSINMKLTQGTKFW